MVVYSCGVGPESSGYLANDPPVDSYSPNTFIFRSRGPEWIGYLDDDVAGSIPAPGFGLGSSVGRAHCWRKPLRSAQLARVTFFRAQP